MYVIVYVCFPLFFIHCYIASLPACRPTNRAAVPVTQSRSRAPPFPPVDLGSDSPSRCNPLSALQSSYQPT